MGLVGFHPLAEWPTVKELEGGLLAWCDGVLKGRARRSRNLDDPEIVLPHQGSVAEGHERGARTVVADPSLGGDQQGAILPLRGGELLV